MATKKKPEPGFAAGIHCGNSIGEVLMELGIANGRLDALSHHLHSAVEVMEMPEDLVHEIFSEV